MSCDRVPHNATSLQHVESVHPSLCAMADAPTILAHIDRPTSVRLTIEGDDKDSARDVLKSPLKPDSSSAYTDAGAELRAVDEAVRAALGLPLHAEDEPSLKRSTIELVRDLIQVVGTREADAYDSLEDCPPWGTPTKAAVERFAEELELVLKEKQQAEADRERALALRSETVVACERLQAHVKQSEKELHFAQGEIVRLTKKVNEMKDMTEKLREESGRRWEQLKKVEKHLIEARVKEEEAERTIVKLRRNLHSERQIFKSKDSEISRLQNALRDITNSKKGEKMDEDHHTKRFAELEAKIVQLAFAVSKEPSAQVRSHERELEIIVQELAREELKSRARADAAEKLVFDLRSQLDTKTTEVIGLRAHLDHLDRTYSSDRIDAKTPISRGRVHSSRAGASVEEIDKTLQQSCERAEQLVRHLSTVISSGGLSSRTPQSERQVTIEPLSETTDRSDRVRELQLALDAENARRDTAEKFAAKAAGEAAALREALVTAERIASAAAAMANERGLTGAYVTRSGTESASNNTTVTPVGKTPLQRTPATVSSTNAPTGLLRELAKARRTAEKERKQREEAEETIRRWSRLEDSYM